MRTTTARTLGLVLALGVAACSSPQVARPARPFDPALARYFDDAVDYVTDVEGLGGRVARDWQRQIDTLSREADLIATARIETVLLGADGDRSRVYRLTAAVDRVLRGETPEDRRVALRVSEGTAGFNTVHGNDARLQNGRYILFVEWYTDGAGDTRAHWHLSPLSDPVLARVNAASGLQAAGQERIVTRESSGGSR